MALTAEQKSMLAKMAKYYKKHLLMIEEYKKKETRDVAVKKYSAIFPVKAKLYEAAWEHMPANYEAKLKLVEDRIKNWIITFSKKMFGVVPTDAEVSDILSEIKKVTPVKP